MKKLVMVTMVATMIGAAACSTLGHASFEQPVVTLKDVRVRGVGISGGSLDVLLNVYNPNHYRLDATQLAYAVKLGNDVQLANGLIDSHFTVQDRDSTVVPIPVTFTYAGLGEAGRQLMQTGSVNYTVTGNVTVGTVIGNYTIPYSSSGRFSTLAGTIK